MVNKKAASLFLLAVMVLSALGVYTTQPDNSTRYNDYVFYPTTTGWQVSINNQQYQFHRLPTDIDFPPITIPKAEKIYIAHDPSAKNITAPVWEMSGVLRQFNILAVPACISEKECPSEFPIVSCESATAPVIYFRASEEKGTLSDGKCVIIQAPTSLDLNNAVERTAYQLLGVMKNE